MDQTHYFEMHHACKAYQNCEPKDMQSNRTREEKDEN